MVEVSYLILFLVLENVISQDYLAYFDSTIFKKSDFIAEKTTEEIFNQLVFVEKLDSATILGVKMNFLDKVKLIIRRYTIFDFQLTSFTSKSQLDFFLETYAVMSQVIQSTVPRYLNSLVLDDQSALTKFFYDYLFTLIDCCPLDYIQKPIYVCVDFSQGEPYTNYMIKQVQGFKNFNIKIETRLSTNTDIYVSDCLVENNKFKHILWKNPPAADDWEDFGNTIVAVSLQKNKIALLAD